MHQDFLARDGRVDDDRDSGVGVDKCDILDRRRKRRIRFCLCSICYLVFQECRKMLGVGV